MGTLFVDKLDPQSGTSLELGSSGDTVSVNASATTNLAGNVTLGANGKTVTVPSGCTITNSGTATGFGESNEPYFMARGTGDQTVSSGANSVLAFNTLVDSLDSASGYNTSNYRYTIQSGGAGLWYFEAGIYLQSMSDGNQNDIALWVNGSETFVERKKNGGSVNPYLNISAIKKYAVGDYIEARLYHNGGSDKTAVTQNSSSRFAGFRIKSL